jgi:hypothetical protein
VIILFSTLELSVYRIQDRQKLFALKLPLCSSHATSIFPVSNSKSLVLGTNKVNLLLLDLDSNSLNDYAIPFTNIHIKKIEQILTKENNFVFLNDYNQILFCKFIQERSAIQSIQPSSKQGKLRVFLEVIE